MMFDKNNWNPFNLERFEEELSSDGTTTATVKVRVPKPKVEDYDPTLDVRKFLFNHYACARPRFFTAASYKNRKIYIQPEAEAVYVNKDKRTVVIKWTDETVTKVKCDKKDKFDAEKGVLFAIAKKVLGNYTNVQDILDKIEENNKKEGKK